MMARLLLAGVVALGLAACGVVSAQGGEPPPSPEPLSVDETEALEATVMRVIDGHSLDARVLGNRTAVGYLGVETPNRDAPCGEHALERNRELAAGRVLLEEDWSYQLDDVGRRLFYAYTADGRSIDEILIREGLGRAVRTDARHGALLEAVQAEAQAARRGCLWSG